jgi:hypothetical protein
LVGIAKEAIVDRPGYRWPNRRLTLGAATFGGTMQIILHVVAEPRVRGSLREWVISDLERSTDYQLRITREKKTGRNPGWAKVKAEGVNGTMNIDWDAHSKTLTARAIGREGKIPGVLVGRFIRYLVEKHLEEVKAVTIHSM